MPKNRDVPKDSKKKAWQMINESDGRQVERMRVPSGWLYAVTAVADGAKGQSSLVFIPLQNREKQAAAANDQDGEVEIP